MAVDGQGSVALDPSGGSYECGTTVSLTAVADAGWLFVCWEGDLTGSNNPAELNVDDDLSVTAVFDLGESEYTVPPPPPVVGPCGLASTGFLSVTLLGLLWTGRAQRRQGR